MAIGPSIIFIAPSWEPDVTRSLERRGNPVPVGAFHAWLKDRGFFQHPGPGNNFTRKPIDIYVHRVGEEVAFTTIEFGVVNDAPDRVDAWQAFVEELCATWGFSLTDDETREKVPLDQFRRLLAQHRIWRIASEVNGWPPIWPARADGVNGQSAEPILHESSR